jgi:hypothetical protein
VGGDDGVGGRRGGYDMSIFNVRVQNVTSSIVISSSLVALLLLYCSSIPLLPYLICLFRNLTREFCDDNVVCDASILLATARHPVATRIVVCLTPTIIASQPL